MDKDVEKLLQIVKPLITNAEYLVIEGAAASRNFNYIRVLVSDIVDANQINATGMCSIATKVQMLKNHELAQEAYTQAMYLYDLYE